MEFQLSLRQLYQLLRKEKKIKLKDLAPCVGVSIPMLSMYENEVVNLQKDKETIYRDLILRSYQGGGTDIAQDM